MTIEDTEEAGTDKFILKISWKNRKSDWRKINESKNILTIFIFEKIYVSKTQVLGQNLRCFLIKLSDKKISLKGEKIEISTFRKMYDS